MQKKNLYIPGFTYMEMLTYSVRLRMVGAKAVDIRTRVQELLDIMNLNACRDRIIPEYPSMRGEAGGDLKKLSIAIEIAALPPIIVLDEPIKGFDIGIAMGILESLRKLTLRGIAVICSFDKVAMKMLPLIDNLVLLSGGYSIYTGSPRSVEEHFCGPNLGYVLKQGVNISDFMLDVASGVERPTAQRGAELPAIMQEKFEQSPLYEEIRVGSNACSAFADSFFKWYGYARIDSVAATYYRSSIVIERAFWSKIKDKESLKVTFGGALVLSLLLGYLEYGNGTGRYCASLLGIPYAETTNIMALLFVSTGFTFFVYVLNVHVICEKLRLFRYERNSGCCSLPAFGIATLVSEIPFSIASVWIYGSILYFLVKLDVGSDNFFYWIGNLCMFSVEGLTTAYLLSSLFRREFAVREAYLSVFLLCVLLSGFVFQLSSMTYYISDATVVNPLR